MQNLILKILASNSLSNPISFLKQYAQIFCLIFNRKDDIKIIDISIRVPATSTTF